MNKNLKGTQSIDEYLKSIFKTYKIYYKLGGLIE